MLDILLLADQYQVEGIEVVCTATITRLVSLAPITWDVAERVLQLPPDHLGKPGFQHILKSLQVRAQSWIIDGLHVQCVRCQLFNVQYGGDEAPSTQVCCPGIK
jgi:hypothetical protein